MHKKGFFVGLILMFAALTMSYYTYLYSGNILYNYPDWVSSKTLLHKPVMGAQAFRMTKVALHNDQLDLSTWHGHQELLYREPGKPAKVSFDMQLDGSCVSFIYGKTDAGSSAVRFCNDPEISYSALLQIDPTGKFLEIEPARSFSFKPGQWYHIELDLTGEQAGLYIDGVRSTVIPHQSLEPGHFGFKGGWSPSRIDNIDILLENDAVIREAFNTKFSLIVKVLLLLLGGMLLLALLFTGIFRQNGLLYGGILAVLITGIVCPVYYYNLSARYPTNFKKIDWNDLESRIATPEQVEKEVLRAYARPEDSGAVRMLVIGSSQTWGAGASSHEALWTTILERELREGFDLPGLEVINSGISATYSRQLFEIFAKHYETLAPDMVVINLGINDFDLDLFRAALLNFVDLHDQLGIETVFIQEANSPGFPFLLEKHAVMADIAAERNIPIINMQEKLIKRSGEGFLWWDGAHLSDYGQLLLAEELVMFISDRPDLMKVLLKD